MISFQFNQFVGWYQPHAERKYLPLPVTLWSPELEPLSETSFMPINRIAGRCAQAQVQMVFPERPYNNGKTIIIIPRLHRQYLVPLHYY